MTRFLYVFKTGPYQGAAGQEGLDAVLAGSALDIEISVLFCDDAVFQLKRGQAENDDVKNYTKGFAALPDFGIESVYVELSSLLARGLEESDLTISVQTLELEPMRALIANHDQVMVF